MDRGRDILIPLLIAASLICLSAVLWRDRASAQPGTPPGARALVTIPLTPALTDSAFQLPDRFLLEGSDTLRLARSVTLRRGVEYAVDYRNGRVSFSPFLMDSLLRIPATAQPELSIEYRYLPYAFQRSYQRRTPVVLADSAGRDSMTIARPTVPLSTADIFGPNLQKSGSIVRGFNIGTNRDLSPTSGLRLQMSGKLGPDIDIAAALTDENTPIQPEGTTQSLQEFDRVFVEIRSANLGASLGDFVYDANGGTFGTFSRKLQGGMGKAAFTFGSIEAGATIMGAVNRGKKTTNQFNGIEGVQGPYRLTGRNGESFIIVLAGTERVYVNGELQVRGETNDYVIDYSIGELTFMPRRLITGASRITIDFEYTDRQYSRSIYGGQARSALLGPGVALSVGYVREADDPDAPLDFVLTDSARQALGEAGADRDKAVLSGVTQVDSNGLYRAVDTVLQGGVPYRFYRYAPGDPQALYVVSFSFAGAGEGEYVREQVGVFRWVGAGGGDYLPVRYVPLPEEHDLLNAVLTATPVNGLTLDGQFGRSTYDPNMLSFQNVSESGNAYEVGAVYAPTSLSVLGAEISGLELRLRERFLEERFVPIDRINDIEFNRKWGIDSVQRSSEEQREASLRLAPLPGVTAGGGYGKLQRGDVLDATRIDGTLTVVKEGLPVLRYRIEEIRTDDRTAGVESDWLRQRGALEYTVDRLTPFIGYEGEERNVADFATGTVAPTSLQFDEWSAGVRARDLGPLALGATFGWRDEATYLNGVVQPEFSAFTQMYTGRYVDGGGFSTSLDVTLRDTRYTDAFRAAGKSDIRTVLLRNQTRYATLDRGLELDLFYETATERTARRQRVFVRVAKGTGSYRYAGDLNANGIADDSEFEPTRFDGDFVPLTLPTDELFPVINLETSARLRITPRRFLGTPDGAFEQILSALGSETYARVGEQSTDPELANVYLLRLGTFQNDSTTIAGSILFTQDISVFEGAPDFSGRIRYSERTGMTSLATGPERAYARERSLRLRAQLVEDIAQQLDIVNRTDAVGVSPVEGRVHDITSNDITLDISYRPVQTMEYGMKIGVGRSRDRRPEPDLEASGNAQAVRFVYAFEGAGQVRAGAAREEVDLNYAPAYVPFELTGGRTAGITWLWNASFEYRVTTFIQASLGYDGRSDESSGVVHTGRAELRAFF